MKARSEKPSATESSTDTMIGALNIIADLLDTNPDQQYMIEAISVREAAQRLDKLEKEIHFTREAARSEAEFADELNEKLKAQQFKTLRDEFAMQALNGLIGQCRTEDDYKNSCRVSYIFADAMMEARK